MAQSSPWLQWRVVAGAPVTVGDLTITPRTRVLYVSAPFGGFVYNHPQSVQVTRNGETQDLNIPDSTLVGQFLLLAVIGLIFVLIRSRR